MPTEFTKCDECNYIRCLGIDHRLNKDYKDTKEAFDILSIKLPLELVYKIILLSNSNINICNYCNKTKLCINHYERAIKYGNYYRGRGAMCDSCCWFEVS